MNDRVRLPLTFDAAAMQADMARLEADAWIRHFVKDNYDGDWTVLPLRSPATARHPVQTIYSDPMCDEYVDTPLLGACPSIASALAAFQCPLRSVRLMRLGAGSVIKTHSDNDLDIASGRVRLHIPIETNPGVDFRLNGEQVVLGEGECWYLRLSDPHSVSNRGDRDRVHLVIDAIVSPWLYELIEQADAGQPPASSSRRPASGSDLPVSALEPPAWVPVGIDGAQRIVEWREIGSATFAEPFFEDTIQRAGPTAASARTPLSVLGEQAAAHPGLPPAAFIFHCSRCGSTLVSQLARAVPGTVVISEAPPIDDVLGAPWPRDERIAVLRGVVNALGHARAPGDRQLIVKFDAWSTLDLPLVREAFGGVPCVFVYRDPAAVVASQMRMTGQYLIPGRLDPAVAGLESVDQVVAVGREEYAARVIGRILSAAAEYAAADSAMILLNYQDFPGAAIETVLARTGASASAVAREKLTEVATFDAKTPGMYYQAQPSVTRDPASAIAIAANRFAAAPFATLERLRLAR
jgi:hypothetical protein